MLWRQVPETPDVSLMRYGDQVQIVNLKEEDRYSEAVCVAVKISAS